MQPISTGRSVQQFRSQIRVSQSSISEPVEIISRSLVSVYLGLDGWQWWLEQKRTRVVLLEWTPSMVRQGRKIDDRF